MGSSAASRSSAQSARAQRVGGQDARVDAVLRVLAGQPARLVAVHAGVGHDQLQSWVRAFVDAGSARVANRPEPVGAHQGERFLAALAHEVRTPLSIAQGWATMLQDKELDERQSAAAVDRLIGALAHLADRTREVELLAAASLGRLRLAPETISAHALSAHLPDRGTIGGDGGATKLQVDADLLGRVLRDLWHAARTTAPLPATVRLEIRDGSQWQELRIVREGDPISAQVLLAMFEPFDANHDATGVTVGLYLARALAVAHGGSIGAEQDDERGVLWLRVPRHAVPPATAQDA